MLPSRPRRPGPRAFAAIGVVLLLAAAAAIGPVARGLVALRLRQVAAGRDAEVSWRSLRVGWPLRVALVGLTLRGLAAGDTLFRAESLSVVVDPWSPWTLHPRASAVTLAHATLRLPPPRVDPDTLPPEAPARGRRDRPERVRRAAWTLARLSLAPARSLPRLAWRDITLESAGGEAGDSGGARLSWLVLTPGREAVGLEASGTIELHGRVPFDVSLLYSRGDRLAGGARFGVPDAERGGIDTLRVAVDGRIAQDRRAGELRVSDSTRVTIGRLPFTVSGSLSRAGPGCRVMLAADGLTAAMWRESLPGPLLGPLRDLAVHGSFDYRLALDLDLGRPDSVGFTADVVPHGLFLAPSGLGAELLALADPFTASIHLPHGRIVHRELSPANPRFRTLDTIDSTLVHAVLASEDGAFFGHRGFNLEAVREAIAENVRSGSFRRGAGTITMQLARNLFLGHERTLSRKAQEVVLAWTLEHLTGLSKRRLLEIYLNIVEWGPGVQGADEAARFYYGCDASRLTAPQALFLAILLPAPARWTQRLDGSGELRPFARAQMHFVGRAMTAKGWLDPEALPPTDSLRVELLGPARDALFAALDSLRGAPAGAAASTGTGTEPAGAAPDSSADGPAAPDRAPADSLDGAPRSRDPG